TSSSSLQYLNVYARNAERLSNLLSDSTTGLTATLQNFVNALQGVANSPASVPARQVLLGEAQTLQQRLQEFAAHLAEMDREVNFRLQTEVAEVNSIAQALAKLNLEITAAYGRTGGRPPNDLLDQRDRLLDQLPEKVSINSVVQNDGAVNAIIVNGPALVLGTQASELTDVPDEFDPVRFGVAIRTANGPLDITANIRGGALGGWLDYRREQLDPARNTIGRITLGLAEIVNTQPMRRADLSGEMGGAFFAVGAPEVLPSTANTGSGAVTATIADVQALTQRDYVLELTADGWQLRDAHSGAAVMMTGSGTQADPFVAEGVALVVDGSPSVGDRFLIRPTRSAIDGLDVLISDPSKIAAAAPLSTGIGAGNLGTGEISEAEITDPAGLVTSPVQIRFTSASTYSIDGGPDVPFTGSPIEITHNGWTVTITGAPAVGDTFTVR